MRLRLRGLRGVVGGLGDVLAVGAEDAGGGDELGQAGEEVGHGLLHVLLLGPGGGELADAFVEDFLRDLIEGTACEGLRTVDGGGGVGFDGVCDAASQGGAAGAGAQGAAEGAAAAGEGLGEESGGFRY